MSKLQKRFLQQALINYSYDLYNYICNYNDIMNLFNKLENSNDLNIEEKEICLFLLDLCSNDIGGFNLDLYYKLEV